MALAAVPRMKNLTCSGWMGVVIYRIDERMGDVIIGAFEDPITKSEVIKWRGMYGKINHNY